MLDPTRFALNAATVGFRKRMGLSVDWDSFHNAVQNQTDAINVRRELEMTKVTELHVMGGERYGLGGNEKTATADRQARQMNGYPLRSFLATGGAIVLPPKHGEGLMATPMNMGLTQYTQYNGVVGNYVSSFTEPLNAPLDNNSILLGRAGLKAQSESASDPYKALQFQMNLHHSQAQIKENQAMHETIRGYNQQGLINDSIGAMELGLTRDNYLRKKRKEKESVSDESTTAKAKRAYVEPKPVATGTAEHGLGHAPDTSMAIKEMASAFESGNVEGFQEARNITMAQSPMMEKGAFQKGLEASRQRRKEKERLVAAVEQKGNEMSAAATISNTALTSAIASLDPQEEAQYFELLQDPNVTNAQAIAIVQHKNVNKTTEQELVEERQSQLESVQLNLIGNDFEGVDNPSSHIDVSSIGYKSAFENRTVLNAIVEIKEAENTFGKGLTFGSGVVQSSPAAAGGITLGPVKQRKQSVNSLLDKSNEIRAKLTYPLNPITPQRRGNKVYSDISGATDQESPASRSHSTGFSSSSAVNYTANHDASLLGASSYYNMTRDFSSPEYQREGGAPSMSSVTPKKENESFFAKFRSPFGKSSKVYVSNEI